MRRARGVSPGGGGGSRAHWLLRPERRNSGWDPGCSDEAHPRGLLCVALTAEAGSSAGLRQALSRGRPCPHLPGSALHPPSFFSSRTEPLKSVPPPLPLLLLCLLPLLLPQHRLPASWLNRALCLPGEGLGLHWPSPCSPLLRLSPAPPFSRGDLGPFPLPGPAGWRLFPPTLMKNCPNPHPMTSCLI